MTGIHAETPGQSIELRRSVVAFVLLVGVVVAAAIGFAGWAPFAGTEAPSTPSLERLRELASIYDGQQFGYVPTPSTPSLDRLRELASIYDGQQFGYVPTPSTPSLDRLRELASIYDGQQFGHVPLDG